VKVEVFVSPIDYPLLIRPVEEANIRDNESSRKQCKTSYEDAIAGKSKIRLSNCLIIGHF